MDDSTIKIIAVGLHAGFRGGDDFTMDTEMLQTLEKEGIQLYFGSHALSGVGRSISNEFGGVTPVEIIGRTLKMFCGNGLKVAVEISVMAADAGLIPTTKAIIALGGTHGGLDTALVLKPSHMNNFFDMEIREILAKPTSGE